MSFIEKGSYENIKRDQDVMTAQIFYHSKRFKYLLLQFRFTLFLWYDDLGWVDLGEEKVESNGDIFGVHSQLKVHRVLHFLV